MRVVPGAFASTCEAKAPGAAAVDFDVGRGFETLGEPATQNRHGSSTALVIPIRGPATTGNDAHPGGGASIATGPAARSVPFSSSPIPSACVSLPGPEQRSSTPRLARMSSTPASGSSARISTAAPTPSGSQTAFSSAWIPYER